MKDPLVRRFISASFFSALFIWAAVYFFDVEAEVVRVLFMYSVFFVMGMVFFGLLLTPLIRMFRSETTLLSKLQVGEEVTSSQEDE